MGKVIAFDAPNKDESSDKSIFKVFLGGTIESVFGDSVHRVYPRCERRD